MPRSAGRRFCLILCALVGTVIALEAQATQKVKVFVVAHKDASGFVDASNRYLDDSIKDIREAITKKKKKGMLQLVEAEEQADIVLEVTGRTLVERDGTSSTTNTTYSKDGKTASSTTTTNKEHDVVVKGVMHVGDYTNELTGTCDLGYLFGGSYRKAASNLVDSLEDWVKANYTRLQLKKLD